MEKPVVSKQRNQAPASSIKYIEIGEEVALVPDSVVLDDDDEGEDDDGDQDLEEGDKEKEKDNASLRERIDALEQAVYDMKSQLSQLGFMIHTVLEDRENEEKQEKEKEKRNRIQKKSILDLDLDLDNEIYADLAI